MRTLGAVYVIIAALYFLLPLEGAARVWFGNGFLTLAPATAFGAAAFAWSRAAAGARRAWLLIALACAAGLVGQLIWNVYELVWRRPVPFPSVPFFLFMLFHPLLLAGILASLRVRTVRRERTELALDGAVAWSVITLALLRLLFEPLRVSAPHLTLMDQVYIVAGQVVVHGALVGAGVMVVWRDSVLPPRTVAALVAATLANSTANFLVLARLDPNAARSGDPFDLAWLAGWLLVAGAGIAGTQRDAEAWTGTSAADAARGVRNAVLPVSVLIFGLLSIDFAVRGNVMMPTLVATGLSALLLAARAARALQAADREQGERQELERTRALVELSHTLAGAAGLDAALTTVCEWGRRLLVADSAWVELIRADGDVRCRGLLDGRAVVSETTRAQSTLQWLAAESVRQMCTRADQPAMRGPDGAAVAPRMWVAAATIRFGDRALGCLVVAQPDRALDATECELLGALADQAAIAIETARLVDDARQAERNRLRSEKLATVGQLVAGVAHEINNPLACIRSAADLLTDEEAGSEAQSNVRLIQNEAARAAAIVRGMLDFVHPGEIDRVLADPADIVAATLRLRAYEHSVSDIRVVSELGGLPSILVDRNRLQQVLLNLIVNAEQAMAGIDRPRVLRIHGTCGRGTVELHVEDSGIGIAPQHLGRVFDPFFTTKAVGKGTGLGLSVSYGIMRELGGDITVTSVPGNGTRFTVALPASNTATNESAHAPAGGHHTPPASRIGEQRVLLVDDEATLRLLLSRFLRRHGHGVAVACNGREALNLLRDATFDVIITDLKMPEMDGPTLFEHLRATRPELVDRVLFMSGDTVGSATREFLAGSGRPFLAKPFTLAELMDGIGDVARRTAAATA